MGSQMIIFMLKLGLTNSSVWSVKHQESNSYDVDPNWHPLGKSHTRTRPYYETQTMKQTS